MHRGYYANIPASVRYDKNIRANSKLLYGEITALSNEKGYCWASNSYFAELYGVSKTSVSLWVKELIEHGYVTTEIIYKEGSKEIDSRRLRINDPYLSGVKGGYLTKVNEPTQEKLKDNTTINNTKDIVEKTHDTNSLEIKKIVDYLNKKADKNFKSSSSATKKHINARLNEGFTFDDFVVVIDAKVAEWKDDKTMMKYIRPETLFGGKFDGYLNENTKKRKEQKESNSKGFNLDSFHDDL